MKRRIACLILLIVPVSGYAQNTFPASGNVGIGTTKPGTALDVIGTIRSTGGFASWGSGQLEVQLINEGDPANQRFTELIAQGGVFTGRFVNDAYNLADTWLSVTRNAGTYTVKNVVFPAGSVGMGTTTPDATVDAVGASRFELTSASIITSSLMNGGAGSVPNDVLRINAPYSANPTGGSNAGAAWGIRFIGTTSVWDNRNTTSKGPAIFAVSEDAATGFNRANGLSFYTNTQDAASVERVRISNGGNVGIGTTNPTYPLSVNGTVRAKEVIVDTGWSDYVFKKDYKLPSLTEVEREIEHEGHLPGIPSAKDVSEKGISLGEMQAKLLAKIEELTLHQIALEKQVNAQAAQIRQLQSENRP